MEDKNLHEFVDNALTHYDIDQLLDFLKQRDEMYEDIAYVTKQIESRLQGCLINMSENETLLSSILVLINRFITNITLDGDFSSLLSSYLVLVISNKDCSFDNIKSAAICLNAFLDDNPTVWPMLLEKEILEKPIKELGRKLAETGDYECQALLFEVMCRLVIHDDSRPRWASTWFNTERMQSYFLNVSPEQFDTECRKILNFLNRNEPITRVFSFIATSVRFGNQQLRKPQGAEFWIDFNYSSEKISFFCTDICEDEDNDDSDWETVYIPVKIIKNYAITDHLKVKTLTLYLNVSCSELIRLPSATPSEFERNEVKITFWSFLKIDEHLSNLMKPIDPEMILDKPEIDMQEKNYKEKKIKEEYLQKERKFSENTELQRIDDTKSNDSPKKARKVSIVSQTIESSEIDKSSFLDNSRKLSEVNNFQEVNELKPIKIICRKRKSSEVNSIIYIDDMEAEYYSQKGTNKSACDELVEIDVSDSYSKSFNASKIAEKVIYDETESEIPFINQKNSKVRSNLELTKREFKTTSENDQIYENIIEPETGDQNNVADFDEQNKSSICDKTDLDISHGNVSQGKNKVTKQKQRNQKAKKKCIEEKAYQVCSVTPQNSDEDFATQIVIPRKTRKAAMKARKTNKIILEQKESEICSEYSVKNPRAKRTKRPELNSVYLSDKEAQEAEGTLAISLNDEKSEANTESEKSAMLFIDNHGKEEDQELEKKFNGYLDKVEDEENKISENNSMDNLIHKEEEEKVTKYTTPSRKRHKKSLYASDTEAGSSDPSWFKRAKSGLFVTPPLKSYSKKSVSKQKQRENAIKKSGLKKRKSAKKLSKPNSVDSENRPRSLRLSEIDKHSLVIETRKRAVNPLPKGLSVFQFDPIITHKVMPKENSRIVYDDNSDKHCSTIKSSKSNKFSSCKSLSQSKNKENSTVITPIQESLQENNSIQDSLNEFDNESSKSVKERTAFPMSKETLAETWPIPHSNSSRNLSNSFHCVHNSDSKKESKVGITISPESLNSLPGEESGKRFQLKRYLESISSCSSPPPEINWLQEKSKSLKRSVENITPLNPIPKRKKVKSDTSPEKQSLKSTVKYIPSSKKLYRSKKGINNEEKFCVKTISSNDDMSQLNEEMPFSHSVFKTLASEMQKLTQKLFGTLQKYTFDFSVKISIIRKNLLHIIENMSSCDETNKEKDLRNLLRNTKENRFRLQKNLKQLLNIGIKYFEAEKKYEKRIKILHKKIISKYITCAQAAEEEAMKNIEMKLIATAKSLFKVFLKKIDFI